MAPDLRKPRYHVVEGNTVPLSFQPDMFRAALQYHPKAGDVFVVGYPKSGSHWMAYTALLILRKGEPVSKPEDLYHLCPLLEKYGPDPVENMNEPGVIKTHLTFERVPYSPDAKYIYVARNPKDTCVSFYHFAKMSCWTEFEDGTFDEFFEAFMKGNVEFDDYFDHLMSWYPHRDDSNVFFTTYERLKTNTKEEVMKMAEFLGEEYADTLRKEPEVMDKIIHYSSFDYMTKNVNKALEAVIQGVFIKTDTKDSDVKVMLPEKKMSKHKEFGVNGKFVRKGVVGDWRNNFSEEQCKRLEEKFSRRTSGTDIAELWKDYM